MSAYNLCDDDVPRLNILRNNTRMGRVIPFGNLFEVIYITTNNESYNFIWDQPIKIEFVI